MPDLSRGGWILASKIAYSGVRATKSKEIISWTKGDLGLGNLRKGVLTLSDEDARVIEDCLRLMKGITADLSSGTASRSETSDVSHDEKMVSGRASQEQVRITHLPGGHLILSGREVVLPPGCSVLLPLSEFTEICGNMTALLVENVEAFERISEFDFPLADDGENPVIIWRGSYDKNLGATGPAAAAIRAMHQKGVPIDAFCDIDPAGVGIVLGIPGLRRIRHPNLSSMEEVAREMNRGDYEKQMAFWAAKIESSDHPDVDNLVRFLKRMKCRVPQERFIV